MKIFLRWSPAPAPLSSARGDASAAAASRSLACDRVTSSWPTKAASKRVSSGVGHFSRSVMMGTFVASSAKQPSSASALAEAAAPIDVEALDAISAR